MRNVNLDMLKGFLIISVVIGHIPWWIYPFSKPYELAVITKSLYFFHMPLFFAISIIFIKNDYISLFKRILF